MKFYISDYFMNRNIYDCIAGYSCPEKEWENEDHIGEQLYAEMLGWGGGWG